MNLGVPCVPVSHSMTVPDCVGCIGQRKEARSPLGMCRVCKIVLIMTRHKSGQLLHYANTTHNLPPGRPHLGFKPKPRKGFPHDGEVGVATERQMVVPLPPAEIRESWTCVRQR